MSHSWQAVQQGIESRLSDCIIYDIVLDALELHFLFDSTTVVKITNCLEVILIFKFSAVGTMEWILSFCSFQRKYICFLALKVGK